LRISIILPIFAPKKQNNEIMITTTYPQSEVSPVDALWTLIQGQTKAVRSALTKRLVEQERASKAKKAAIKREKRDACISTSEREQARAKLKGAESKKFTKKIKALENDSEGFFKLGGFMADSSSSADEDCE
jgi:hypothetical protein